MTPLDPSNVPINPISANLLKCLYPTPNFGAADSYVNNYQMRISATPTRPNQGDIRFDQNDFVQTKCIPRVLSPYKNRQVTSAPNLPSCTFNFLLRPRAGPMQGTYNTPEIDEGLTFAHNYLFNPRLLNEFRGGFNAQHTSANQSSSAPRNCCSQIGITGVPQPDLDWSEAPQVLINGFLWRRAAETHASSAARSSNYWTT